MNDPTERSTPEPHDDPVADLLAGCLDDAEARFDDALAQLCDDHPAHADAIRDRMIASRGAGSTNGAASVDGAQGYERIGAYQPIAELGRGGQAVVYLAEDTRLNRVVALKVLKGLGALSDAAMQRFRREAEVASKLDHPGICAVFDAGVVEGIPFIAMRHVEGTTLARVIRSGAAPTSGPLTTSGFVDLEDAAIPPKPGDAPRKPDVARVREAVAVIERAARALHVAHEAGVVHRDVKPGNIMLTPEGDPVLLDFGLATGEINELSLTQTGDFFGTPAYMSPEQLLAHRIRVDRRTDVYSLAVSLYEWVTSRRPFVAPTREAIYEAIQYRDPPDARELNPSVSRDLATVLAKALEKNRERRYPTAEAFADELRRIGEGRPVDAKPVSPLGRAARWTRRRPFRAALVATLAVGIPLVTALSAYAIAKQPMIRKGLERERRVQIEAVLERGYDRLAHDADDAIVAFDEALALDPDNPAAIQGRVLAVVRTGDHDRAAALFEASGDDGWAAKRTRADAWIALGRDADAAALMRDAGAPTTPLDFLVAGIRLLEGCSEQSDKRVFREAFEWIRRAALTAPEPSLLYYTQLAHAAGHLRDDELARQAGTALLAHWPESYAANRWAAYALDIAEPEVAVRAVEKAIAIGPETGYLWYRLARAQGNAGRFSDSVASSRRAIELEPDKGLFQITLGWACFNAKRYDEALEVFRRRVEVDDDDRSEALVGCGVTQLAIGRLGDAETSLRSAIEELADGDRPTRLADAWHSLAEVRAAQRRMPDAVAAFRRAVEHHPDSARYRVNLGRVLLITGDADAAFAEFEEAYRLSPDSEPARESLVQCLLQRASADFDAKRFGAAAAAYRRVMAIAPIAPWLGFSLATALAGAGEREEATRALRDAADRLGAWVDALASSVESVEERRAAVKVFRDLRASPIGRATRRPDAVEGIDAADWKRWQKAWQKLERLSREWEKRP